SSPLGRGAMVLLAGGALAQAPTPQAGRGSAAAPAVQSTAGGSVDHGRYIVHEIAMCGQCPSPRGEHGNPPAFSELEGAPVPFRPPWPNDWAIYAPRNKGLPGYDD